MRPLKLTVKGLRSWSTRREVPFADLGLVAIVGDTGAGKSSLLEAICYALYNQPTYTGGPKTLISTNEATMSVSLEFLAAGETWRVTRSTSRKSYPPAVHRLQCVTDSSVPMVEGETPVNARIVELVGLDFNGFTSAVLLPQGRFKTLLEARESDRAKILKGIFGLDVVDDVRELANTARRAAQPRLEQAQQERAALLQDPEAELRAAIADEARAEHVTGTLSRVAEALRAAERDAATLDGEAASLEATTARLARLSADIRDIGGLVPVAEAFAREEDELRAQGTRWRARLDAAGEALAEHAGRGETLEDLSAAAALLSGAAGRRAELAARAGGLDRRAGELATQEAALAERRAALETEQRGAAERAALAAAARADAAAAAQALTEARQALTEARRARTQADTSAHTRDRALAAVEAGAAAERGAAAVVRAAQEAADRAAEALEAARRRNAAAAAAEHVHAGDPCPVCERRLPDGFAAPRTGDLDEAAAASQAAVAELAGAQAQAAEASGQLRAARGLLAEAERGLREALATADEALAALPAALDSVADLARGDDELLRARHERAEAAEREARALETEVASRAARWRDQAETLDREATGLAEAGRQLAAERADLDQARRTLQAELDGLPVAVRPGDGADVALTAASRRCQELLVALRALRDEREAAHAGRSAVEDRYREMLARRRAELEAPRQEAVGAAQAAAGALAGLPEPPPLPEGVAADAGTAAHVAFTRAMRDACAQATEALTAAAGDRRRRAAALRDGQRGALREADAAHPDGDVASLADVEEAAQAWRDHLAGARAHKARAEHDAALAPALDDRVARLARLRDVCEDLASILTDGKFIKWLVARRQEELLAFASDVLADLTRDRYRFNASFEVVDNRSKTPRNTRTLSGGEGFLASLALALGMVELTSRSGGKMRSFFLDEGFGSLDPNALNAAIDALQQRADDGRLIVLVSHVKAVADQIGSVLRVVGGADGSDFVLLDEQARAELAEEALAEELAPPIGELSAG